MHSEEKVFSKVRPYFILAALLIATPNLLSLYIGNTGKLLVATDKMKNDPFFKQKVVYVLGNDVWGARGIVINNPIVNSSPEKYNIHHKNANIYNGGPVAYPSLKVAALNKIRATSRWRTQPLTVVSYKGIEQSYPLYSDEEANLDVYVGYTGWSMGQLEREIKSGVWEVVDCNIINLRARLDISEIWQYLNEKNTCPE